MKFFDENELIAYHFQELTPRRATEVRQMLATDADAGAAFAALEEMLEAFRDYGSMPVVNAEVVERNWQAIRVSLPYMGSRPVKVGWGRAFRWHPLGMGLAGLGAAALVVLGVMMVLPTGRMTKPVAGGAEHAAAVAPSPSAAMGGLPVVGELLGHKVVAERVNGRPGPLTTAPVVSDDSDVKDAMLVASVNPMAVIAPSVSNVEQDYSSSASLFQDGSAGRPTVVCGRSAARLKRMKEGSSLPMREMDIAVGGFGDVSVFSEQNLGSQGGGIMTETSQPTAGARISFDQQFKRWLGYEVAFGGSHTSFLYANDDAAPTPSSIGSISGRVFEMSATYEVQGPRSRKISSFANVGGGAVIFQPTGNGSIASANYQPALAMGLGGEYHATRHWGVRAAYRGMFLVGPDFNYTGSGAPVVSHKMWSSEPTLSVVYHFGAQDKD